MAVNRPNIEYISFYPRWNRLRDAISGEDAVKAAGERYLPKLPSEDDTDYKARKDRACYFNATGRTKDGLQGFLFRKDPQIKLPNELEYLKTRTDGYGKPLYEFVKTLATQQVSVGRAGILVDMSTVESAENLPYLSLYKAEDIINWRTAEMSGNVVLTMVVLRETISEESEDDPFGECFRQRFRVLRLVNENGSPVYKQEVWIEDKTSSGIDTVASFVSSMGIDIMAAKGTPENLSISKQSGKEPSFTKLSEVYPKVKGDVVPFIPFVFVNSESLSPSPEKPPLEDLVIVNLAHYRASADLEHGRHFTALPTPVFAGFPNDKITLGPSQALVTQDSSAKASFLEFSGSGLSSLERSLSEKESQMHILGARLLEPNKKAAEAAETVKLRQSGDVSVLTQIAITLDLAVEKALSFAAYLVGADNSEISVEVNTQFVEVNIPGSEITALISAWQEGAISQETLLENLKNAEVISSSTTIEDEKKRIESENMKKKQHNQQ